MSRCTSIVLTVLSALLCVVPVSSAGISGGETAYGLLEAGQSRTYTFEANALDSVCVLLSECGGDFFPKVELRSPGGTLLKSAEGVISASLKAVVLYQTGTYTLTVSDINGTAGGAYGLTLIRHPGLNTSAGDADGGPISSGQTKHGTLGCADLDAFSFSADAGDTVNIQLSECSGEFFPEVQLHGPGGTVLAGVTGTIQATISAQKLTLSGIYTIVVRDSRGTMDGIYALTFLKSPGATGFAGDPDGGDIVSAETRSGTLTCGDLDAFRFQAAAGQSATVMISECSGVFFPQVELHAPDGSHVVTKSGTTGATIRSEKLTQNGTYTLICRDINGTASGSYTITLQLNPGAVVWPGDDDGGLAGAGHTLAGAVSCGDMDCYVFSATAGSSVRIRMEEVYSISQFFPLVELHSPSGLVVASQLSVGISEIGWTVLAEDGTYMVVCRDQWGTAANSYRLTVDMAGKDVSAGNKDVADGGPVALNVAVVTAVFGDDFYAEHPGRMSGIRVRMPGHAMQVGQRLSVTGVMRTDPGGERYLEATSVIRIGAGDVKPLVVSCRAVGGGPWNWNGLSGQRGVSGSVGLNTIGLLLQTTGFVSHVDETAGTFTISDSSRWLARRPISDSGGAPGIRVKADGLQAPPMGTWVRVTGVASCHIEQYTPYPLLLPRSQADIQEVAAPISD